MSVGMQKFEILLDRPDHTFSPGETVAGRLFIELNRPKSIRCLKIRIKGAAEVRWSESDFHDDDKSTTYRANELYFREDVYALGNAHDSENVEIEAGSHIFPFKFILPHNIPSSLKTFRGEVKYTVKAIIERPWKFDHKTITPFDVVTPYDLTRCTNLGTVIYREKHEPFGLLKKAGTVDFTVHVQSNGIAIGEDIQAKIDINNESTADVTKVKLRLEQVIKHHSQLPFSKTATLYKTVQKAKENRNFGKKDEVVLRMQVPTLPYSDLENCKIIDIEYYVKVLISLSGLNSDVERKYPIKIGTKSVAGVGYAKNPGASINAPTFEAPLLPPGESMTNAAPPSYNEAMQPNDKQKL